MQTVLLIDESAPMLFADRTALADELDAVTGYMKLHGIVGDGLAVGDSDVLRLSTDGRSIESLITAPPMVRTDAAARMASAVDRLRAFPDDDRLIVVVTEDPATWTVLAQPSAARDLTIQPADRAATDRVFIVDLSGRAATSGLGVPPHVSPSVLPASATSRGDLAESIARAWVAGFDGGWPTG